MMPASGQFAELAAWHYDDGFGGDFNYTRSTLKVNSFHKLGKKFVLGLRLEGSVSDGDYPFYSAPYVKLRGIPALRYQGESAGVVEIELRYQFAKRWAVLGFTGEGWIDERNIADETENEIDAYGFGIRWQALPAKNVWVGLDLARGPEEDAFYIQLVHPW
jgi:hemolysin activation/secretion protein